jgi:hypothetical protein
VTATVEERVALLLRVVRSACRLYGGQPQRALAHEVVTRVDAARELFARANFASPEERQAFVERFPWIRKEG